jgi:glutaredoxin
MWKWLGAWRRGGRRADWQIVLYTRQGCHLCEHVWQQLEGWRRTHGFVLTAVDVDTDSHLAAEHGRDVPVVVVNGRVRFRGEVNPVLLRRLFRSGTTL